MPLVLPKVLECCIDKVQVSESYQGGKKCGILIRNVFFMLCRYALLKKVDIASHFSDINIDIYLDQNQNKSA